MKELNKRLLTRRVKMRQKKASVVKGKIKITFPYSPEGVSAIKRIPGRSFDEKLRCWWAPISIEAVDRLTRLGFYLVPELEDLKNRHQISLSELPTVKVRGLKRKLYKFQRIGVSFLAIKHGRGLIGDEMGLGKTVQALAYLQFYPRKRPVVIVCPASAKLVWKSHARRWLYPNPKIQVLESQTPYELSAEIIIINYDILAYWVDKINNFKPRVVITDECHYYKSPSAKRTKAIFSIAKKPRHFIALSGTPIENRPVEIFNACTLIDPTIFPDYWSFVTRYCGAKQGPWGLEMKGATNMQELHQKLTSTIMIRRLKRDVLKDLPAKQRAFVPIEIDNRNEYEQALNNFLAYVASTKGGDAAVKAANAIAFSQTETLKQVAVRGKMRMAIKWIKDFLDSSDQKLVIFSHHLFVVDMLKEEFGDIIVDTRIDKQAAVDSFQVDNKIRLFNGRITADGVVITLTAAANVIFLEYPWAPGKLVQAEDRVHRIGQKDAVNVWYLLAEETIEEDIAQLLDKKRKMLDKILDGKDTDEQSLITELIKLYYGKTKKNKNNKKTS